MNIYQKAMGKGTARVFGDCLVLVPVKLVVGVSGDWQAC